MDKDDSNLGKGPELPPGDAGDGEYVTLDIVPDPTWPPKGESEPAKKGDVKAPPKPPKPKNIAQAGGLPMPTAAPRASGAARSSGKATVASQVEPGRLSPPVAEPVDAASNQFDDADDEFDIEDNETVQFELSADMARLVQGAGLMPDEPTVAASEALAMSGGQVLPFAEFIDDMGSAETERIDARNRLKHFLNTGEQIPKQSSGWLRLALRNRVDAFNEERQRRKMPTYPNAEALNLAVASARELYGGGALAQRMPVPASMRAGSTGWNAGGATASDSQELKPLQVTPGVGISLKVAAALFVGQLLFVGFARIYTGATDESVDAPSPPITQATETATEPRSAPSPSAGKPAKAGAADGKAPEVAPGEDKTDSDAEQAAEASPSALPEPTPSATSSSEPQVDSPTPAAPSATASSEPAKPVRAAWPNQGKPNRVKRRPAPVYPTDI